VVTRQLQAQVFAGFQQLRYVQPVLPRYTRVAQTAETYVFGQPGDIEIDVPNLQVVELDTQDDLVREWFLVVMHPGYQRALVAREMTAPGTPHARRLFRGIITSESRQVELFSNALREGLGLGERA
jgi:DICT domain-containing protein